jgi:hypothetical protein
VESIIVLEGSKTREVRGNKVVLTLEPGAGQLLELEGYRVEALCSGSAIYGPAAP